MKIPAIALFVFPALLSTCVSADAQDPPPAEDAKSVSVDFIHDVVPLANKLGCYRCHGSGAGQGGFKLSMFAARPQDDYEAWTRASGARRINRVEPAKSLFLLKATAATAHQGGKLLEVDSADYNLLAGWVAGGAIFSDDSRPSLVSIKVSPEEATLEKGKTQQLQAMAVFSDGSQQDVTALATFTSSAEGIVSVDDAGKATAAGYGESIVLVGYMRRFDTVRVMVPQPLPSPFPEMEANNKIDELVYAKLKKLGIPPSELCSDEVFLRRVYLDVIGTLPTPDEAREFLSDTDPQKRRKLIDKLLACDEFADFWALKWGDLFRMKSEYPSNLWPNAVQAYHRWVRDSIAHNKPFDQFARELITAGGSNFRVPPANYYRAFLKRDPQNLAEVTALIFMGARLGCARCHAHPAENWDLEDSLGMAAFFAGVRYKRTQEWKEEIVYVAPTASLRHPTTGEVVPPKFLDGDVLSPKSKTGDRRVDFADWLTSPDNPWFAQNIVNRTWFWLTGRGIVHEVDDLRSTNPPENPELLAYLEGELTSHDYDLKHIYRLILNSRTYQRSSKANEFNQHDVAHFSTTWPTSRTTGSNASAPRRCWTPSGR